MRRLARPQDRNGCHLDIAKYRSDRISGFDNTHAARAYVANDQAADSRRPVSDGFPGLTIILNVWSRVKYAPVQL